jgi:hypothetical protein
MTIEEVLISTCVSDLEYTNILLEIAKEHLPESDEKRQIEDFIVKNNAVIESGKNREKLST